MRDLIFSKLSTDPRLLALTQSWLRPGEVWDNRVFQGESLSDALLERPFIFYTLGNATSFSLSEEDRQPERQFFQVHVHDIGPDFTRIDSLVRVIKAVLQNVQSKEHGVIQINHLETSRDLDDNTLGTITRYIRFEAIKEF